MQDVKVDRNKYIGGSDIPIIMGISPFKTRYQLLQEKAGITEDKFEGNCYTEYGNVMEEKIRNYINTKEKDKFVEGKTIADDIRCHTDGENKTTILEIKTTSRTYDSVDKYKIYLVQLLFYMMKTKRKKGKLAVYFREELMSEYTNPDEHIFDYNFDSAKLHIYDIDIKDYKELTEQIDDAVDAFRNDLERLKENPFLSEEDLEPTEIVELIESLEEVDNKLQEYNEILEQKELLKNKIYEKMLDYRRKKISTEKSKITIVYATKDQEIKKFNEIKFKEENKELYEKYLENSIKKGKKGYIVIK